MEQLKVLISEEEINQRLDELAREIERDYKDKEILALCILKGSVFFAVELTKRISNPVSYEFMEISSYGDSTESSGVVRITKDVKSSIENKHIIIIEDIIDTGRTLEYLIEHLKAKKLASIKLCTLLNKPERRLVDIDVDYVGFDIPDKFVVGYGLDYAEKYRNLPYIAQMEM